MSQQKRKGFLPPLLFLGAAILIIAAVTVWYAQSGGTGAGQLGPRLAVNTERIDFGKQPFDKKVRAEFNITNTGDRPLTLDPSIPVSVVEGC